MNLKHSIIINSKVIFLLSAVQPNGLSTLNQFYLSKLVCVYKYVHK